MRPQVLLIGIRGTREREFTRMGVSEMKANDRISGYLRNFKHVSAVSTLNGRSAWRERKCLFSVANISAPVHSVYAAIKASAGFRPFATYFSPNANGTKKSSSMIDNGLMKRINSRNSSGTRFCLTSSTIVRQIWIWWVEVFFRIRLKRIVHTSFFTKPKAKIYSFASKTNSNFFLPKFFSNLTQFLNNFSFAHSFKRRGSLGNHFTEFFKMFQRLLGTTFVYSCCLRLHFKPARGGNCLFPEFFSCFAKGINNMVFGFHDLSPRFKYSTDENVSQGWVSG